MVWSEAEIDTLEPVLERLRQAIWPVEGQEILVLCSAGGGMVFWLAEKMKTGHILGVEVSHDLVEKTRGIAEEKHLSKWVEFRETGKKKLELPDNSFDGLVSEFIVYPTPTPTEIGQPEMARVLKPGGRMAITDVIVTTSVTEGDSQALRDIGLDYLCEGTAGDFRGWMEAAGLVDVQVVDLTDSVRPLWEHRRNADPTPGHERGYALLLEPSPVQLGKGLFYICVTGRKASV